MMSSIKRPSSSVWVDGIQVNAWYGLRFAELVERFQPARQAQGRLDVSTLSQVPVFPQLPSRLASSMGRGITNPQSENAFFLNVWVPDRAEHLPVFVFIHGGAWLTGGASMPWYDGARLAAQGMVVVSINYRLGALAHLGKAEDCPWPLPVHDLLLGLNWVVEQIDSFGGDPRRLTVAGQSAGGWYAHLLSLLPETVNKIQGVALLSMGTRTPWSADYQAQVMARAYEIEPDLLTVSAEQVLRVGFQALTKKPVQLGYAPSAFLPVASQAIPEPFLDPHWAAEQSHARKFYIRYTAEESASFFFDLPEYLQVNQDQVDEALGQWQVEDLPACLLYKGEFVGADSGLSPYQQLVAASSWRQFQRFPVLYASALRQRHKQVELTRFELSSPLSALGSGHCFDLPFQFGMRQAWHDAPMLEGLDNDTFERESFRLRRELYDFVRSEPLSSFFSPNSIV